MLFYVITKERKERNKSYLIKKVIQQILYKIQMLLLMLSKSFVLNDSWMNILESVNLRNKFEIEVM